MTQKIINQDELSVLADFNYMIANWQGHENAVKIEYDDEYKDFLVTTGEKNVRRGRISKLQAEITAWAENKISAFDFQAKTVKDFTLEYVNGNLSILLSFQETAE